MKTVAFISYKGGTGKTTLAYNMLERATSAGYRVVLCDYDPQGTAVAIWQLRESDRAAGLLPPERPELTVVKDSFGPDMLERLAALRAGDYDLVICDLPGADGFALNRLLSEMDLCLVPVSAGPPDLMVAADFAWMADRLKLPAVFVPSIVPVTPKRRAAMVDELASFGMPVCEVAMVSRVSHQDALQRGCAVCETAPRSPAAGEVNALWQWVVARLELPDPPLYGNSTKEDRHGGER